VGDVLDLAAAEQPIRLIMSDPPTGVEQHDSLRDVSAADGAREPDLATDASTASWPASARVAASAIWKIP
jgi:hypothetical protein